MKIGLFIYRDVPLASVKFVLRTVVNRLAKRHDLLQLPGDFAYRSEDDQLKAADEVVADSEILLGLPNTLYPALASRERTGRRARALVFLLGTLPRGAATLRPIVPFLRSDDVFLATCSADIEMFSQFFANAKAHHLPLAYDDNLFRRLASSELAEARQAYECSEEDLVVLYSGRMTLEKNLHTLLRSFAVVHRFLPRAKLLLAGPIENVPFGEFGIGAVDLKHTLTRMVDELRVPRDRVRHLSTLPGPELRSLYNIASVTVNLTLHHDENFGLSQVEAMACGCPVIGTNWGGLKDTILDGRTGYKVSAVSTPSGVKVNWWEASNRIASVLVDSALRRSLSECCSQHAASNYSLKRFETALDGILHSMDTRASMTARPVVSERLQPTNFAEEFWAATFTNAGPKPKYVVGTRSYEYYRSLISHYAGATSECVPEEAPLSEDQILSLAVPIIPVRVSAYSSVGLDGTFSLLKRPLHGFFSRGISRFQMDDPLYPFEFAVPAPYERVFERVLLALREQPVATYRSLSRREDSTHMWPEVLRWMIRMGLVLRTGVDCGPIPTTTANPVFSRPILRVLRVNQKEADVLSWQ